MPVGVPSPASPGPVPLRGGGAGAGAVAVPVGQCVRGDGPGGGRVPLHSAGRPGLLRGEVRRSPPHLGTVESDRTENVIIV